MGEFVVTTPPTSQLLQPSDVRQRLGLTSTTTDDVLASLIEAATALLDGPEGWLGRALRPQTIELRAYSFPWGERPMRLLCPPVASIAGVSYVDTAGVTQTLDPSLTLFDDAECRLYPAYGSVWPISRRGPGAVRVSYTTGYAPGGAPPVVLHAISLQVAVMNAMLRSDPTMTQETVVGVYSATWNNANDVSGLYEAAITRLLTPLRIF